MTDVEHVFAVLPIEPTCSHANCNEDATHVYPILTRDRGLESYWLCPEHAKGMQEDRIDLANDLPGQEVDKTDVYRILRTCGKGAPGATAPCGALATHVVVVGLQDPHPRLATVSVCEKHLPR